MRSKWKNSFVLNKDSLLKDKTIFNAPKVLLDSSLINNRIEVYNGKKILSLIFREYMVGKRISNFVSSKYTGKVIHVKRKKRIKNK